MVWKERSRVNERMQLIGEYLKGERAMTELCSEFGVSRKTAYKWVARYREDGPAGLADTSRAPLSHPARLDAVVVESMLEARRAHPHWGARKIIAWICQREPKFVRPAASTVSAIFAKYGLSRLRHARRRTPPYTDPFSDASTPNALWCADLKEDFRTGDGRRCYPLTLTDARSRMLLRCSDFSFTLEYLESESSVATRRFVRNATADVSRNVRRALSVVTHHERQGGIGIRQAPIPYPGYRRTGAAFIGLDTPRIRGLKRTRERFGGLVVRVFRRPTRRRIHRSDPQI